MRSPIRSTDSVRIWLILTHERFGRLLSSSSKLSEILRRRPELGQETGHVPSAIPEGVGYLYVVVQRFVKEDR